MCRHSDEVRRAQQAADRYGAEVAALQAAAAARREWEQTEGWRVSMVTGLRGRLDEHWAGVVVAAVLQGDPLAYGIDRLRHARAALASQLARLEATMPPDRTQQLLHAQAELRKRQDHLDDATNRRAEANKTLAALSRRAARQDAQRRLDQTAADLDRARNATNDAAAVVATEQAAVTARSHAEAAIADQRSTLRSRLATLTDALEQTRADRVAELTDGHGHDERLLNRIGPPPADRDGRAVWASLAERIDAALADPAETYRLRWSRHPVDKLAYQLLDGDEHAVRHARGLIATGSPHIDAAASIRPRADPAQPLEADLGL